MPRVTYRVYVVELSKRVFTENWKFRAANPQFNGHTGVSLCRHDQ
jgi:hypothetical protein